MLPNAHAEAVSPVLTLQLCLESIAKPIRWRKLRHMVALQIGVRAHGSVNKRKADASLPGQSRIRSYYPQDRRERTLQRSKLTDSA